MEDLKKIDENKYEFEIGKITVQMEYQETKKKFNDCLLNILKQKLR